MFLAIWREVVDRLVRILVQLLQSLVDVLKIRTRSLGIRQDRLDRVEVGRILFKSLRDRSEGQGIWLFPCP